MSHQHSTGARWRERLVRLAAAAAIAAAGCLPLAAVTPALAADSAHYVDCSASGGGDGSETSPWNTLDSVNATTFGPGDRILFARGTKCVGALEPKGSGASGAPIVVDTYGTGAKPVIDGGGGGDAVKLYNQQYWEIRNLEVENRGTKTTDRRGVHIILEDYGTGNYYRLTNLTVHDVNGRDDKGSGGSAGIQFDVWGKSEKTKFNNVVIDGNDIYTVDRSGINMSSSWKCRASMAWEEDECANQVDNYYPWTEFVVQNNTLRDIGGSGIVMQYTENGLVQNNVAYDTGARPFKDNVAMWVWNADHVTFQYNEAYNTHKLSDNGDGQAWDADYGTDGTVYQYNYSHDNEGGMALFCSWPDVGRGKGTASNAIFRYNVSQNDGYSDVSIKNKTQVLRVDGSSTGAFYNNTIYVPAGSKGDIVFAHDDAEITVANNIIIDDSAGEYTKSKNVRFSHNIVSGSNTKNVPPGQIIADPKLASPGSGGNRRDSVAGYKLTAESPAIGAGIVMPDNGGRDYWGNSVPTGCAPDIGAHQYSTPDNASCSGSGPHAGPISSGLAGKCANAASGANDAKVDIRDCDGGADQIWTVTGQTLTLGGKCLDVAGTANDTSVQLSDCNGGPSQKWAPQANGTLTNAQFGRCLDVPGTDTTNGAQLIIWDCNGDANQKWTLPA